MDTYDIMLYATYALAIFGFAFAIILPLIKSLDDPKGLMKSAAGIIGLAVLFFIAFSISGNEVAPKYEAAPFNLTPGMSQTIGGLLIATYVLSVITILSIVVSELIKSVK
jgi:NADH:ubiquinone oxidoreductase subunit 6 (subunit J)